MFEFQTQFFAPPGMCIRTSEEDSRDTIAKHMSSPLPVPVGLQKEITNVGGLLKMLYKYGRSSTRKFVSKIRPLIHLKFTHSQNIMKGILNCNPDLQRGNNNIRIRKLISKLLEVINEHLKYKVNTNDGLLCLMGQSLEPNQLNEIH